MAYHGLANVRNTCSINTLIQCIRKCDITTSVGKSNDLYSEYKNLCKDLEKNSINPNQFLNTFYKTFQTFYRKGEQLDFTEIYIMSINKFLEETHDPGFISQHQITNNYKSNLKQFLQKKSIDVYNMHYKNSNSKICDKLVGTEIQEISCKQCNEKYHNIDTILWTTLNMSESIEESLQNEFKIKETLDWVCDKCKSVSGTRTIRYWRLPEIWPIVLNRFGDRKNVKGINIPEEIILGNGIELQNEDKTNYELICIANHYGTMQGGHYNAICKETNEWVMYDDLNIVKISNDQKIKFLNNNKACYVLFYKRITKEKF